MARLRVIAWVRVMVRVRVRVGVKVRVGFRLGLGFKLELGTFRYYTGIVQMTGSSKQGCPCQMPKGVLVRCPRVSLRDALVRTTNIVNDSKMDAMR